jgi:sulfonate transport system substrate-binding protein
LSNPQATSRSFPRHLATLISGAAVSALVATAGAGAADAAVPKAVNLSGVTLTVGVFPADGWDVQLKAAGLDNTPYTVKYVTEDSGDLQLQSIDQGTVDVASSSSIPPIFASQTTNNGNFKVVAASESDTLDQDTIVPKGSSIKTIAQLKGQKVGYVPNTTAEYFLLKQLQSAGLNFSDITPVQLTTSDGISALLGGSIAAFADYGTTVIAAEAQGATVLANGGPILAAQTGGLVGGVETSPADLANSAKAAAIADYISRVNAAYHWAHLNPTAWSKIVATATNQTEASAYSQFEQGEKQKPETIGPINNASIAAEQAIADTLLKGGILTKPVTASSFWSTQLGSQIRADEARYKS